MLVAAFIFLAPGADPAVHRKTVETPGVALTAIGVETIDKAVAGKARIGAVRFDLHPGLDNKSGDEIFL